MILSLQNRKHTNPTRLQMKWTYHNHLISVIEPAHIKLNLIHQLSHLKAIGSSLIIRQMCSLNDKPLWEFYQQWPE